MACELPLFDSWKTEQSCFSLYENPTIARMTKRGNLLYRGFACELETYFDDVLTWSSHHLNNAKLFLLFVCARYWLFIWSGKESAVFLWRPKESFLPLFKQTKNHKQTKNPPPSHPILNIIGFSHTQASPFLPHKSLAQVLTFTRERTWNHQLTASSPTLRHRARYLIFLRFIFANCNLQSAFIFAQTSAMLKHLRN